MDEDSCNRRKSFHRNRVRQGEPDLNADMICESWIEEDNVADYLCVKPIFTDYALDHFIWCRVIRVWVRLVTSTVHSLEIVIVCVFLIGWIL